jgi:hypothetical protein
MISHCSSLNTHFYRDGLEATSEFWIDAGEEHHVRTLPSKQQGSAMERRRRILMVCKIVTTVSLGEPAAAAF